MKSPLPDRDTARARELRNNPTPAERMLWRHLQRSQLAGCKFSRQIPIGPFFADFVCRSHKLVVELDGGSHDFTGARDEARTQFLEQNGYRVVRFTNQEVFRNLEGVLAALRQELSTIPTPALRARPSRKREG